MVLRVHIALGNVLCVNKQADETNSDVEMYPRTHVWGRVLDLAEACRHISTCTNQIFGYNCNCWDGSRGKNCTEHVKELVDLPCQNHATYYERADEPLYTNNVVEGLPSNIKPHHAHSSRYDKVGGYLCHCSRNLTESNGQTHIDECKGDPCQNGAACFGICNL